MKWLLHFDNLFCQIFRREEKRTQGKIPNSDQPRGQFILPLLWNANSRKPELFRSPISG